MCLKKLVATVCLAASLFTVATGNVLGSEASPPGSAGEGVGIESVADSGSGTVGTGTTAGSGDGTAGTDTAGTEITAAPVIKNVNTSAIHFINNEEEASDYKLDASEIKRLREIMEAPYLKDRLIEKDETDSFLQENPVQDLSALDGGSMQNSDSVSATDVLKIAKSYLVRNNFYSRPEELAWNGTGFNHKLLDTTGWLNDDEAANKTELLMALYKIKFGPIHSRPLVFNKSSVRAGATGMDTLQNYWTGSAVTAVKDYWGLNTMALFPAGDAYVYESANVYELYLKELVDMGMINKSDLGGTNGGSFLVEYEKYGAETPAWASELAPDSGQIFGHSFNVTSDGFSQSTPSYFDDESMSTLEVFQFLEKFMRLTEKEITEMEADIVTYKYGLNYLEGLSDSEKRTVSFLIAKGVLNYEKLDNANSLNLYSRAKNAEVWELLYRVASVDARYDFSKVQLTDSEAFWQKKGFAQDNYSVESVDSIPICNDAEETAPAVTAVSFFGNLFGKIRPVSAAGKQEYKIIKLFDKTNTYYYKGYKIAELKNSDTGNTFKTGFETKKPKVKNDSVKVNGKKVSVYKVTFTVLGSSKEAALRYVNSNIRMDIKNKSAYATTAFTKLDKDKDGNTVTLISQTTLKEVFKNVTVLEDKVLLNSDTGTTACFLTDQGYALVGNTIYKSDDLYVVDGGNEVYYNVQVIFGLVCNAFFDNIGSNKIFVWDSFPELSASVVSSVSDDSFYNAYYVRGKASGSSIELGKKGGTQKYFYKVDSIASGLSTLVRTFKVNAADSMSDVTLIVDWDYVVPSAGAYQGEYMLTGGQPMSTAQDFFDALYTEPKGQDTPLKKWWDSNIGVSNALANFMYGTKGKTYIRSGWMTPSVTVLCNSGNRQACLEALFHDYGFAIDDAYGGYVNHGTKNFWEYYFNGQAGFTGELQKLAKSNRKWNVYTLAEENGTYGRYYHKKNKAIAYVVSKAGVVYRDLDTDKKRIEYTASSGIVNQIKILTRKADSTVPKKNSTIKVKGKEFRYEGVKDKCYVLSPLFMPGSGDYGGGFDGVVEMDKGPGGFTTKSASIDTLKQNLSDFYDTYFPLQGAKLPTDEVLNKDCSELFGAFSGVSYGGGSDKCYVYNDNAVYQYDHSRQTLNRVNAKGVTGNKVSVHFIPRVYLPSNYFCLYTNNKGEFSVSNNTQTAALECANIFYSGLNNCIIESILADYCGVKRVDDIASKQKLLVGDVCWTKNGEYWYSEPIKNNHLVADARAGNVSKSVLSFYNSIQISCSGQYFSLANYLDNIELASPVKNSNTKKKGTVCRNEQGDIKVWKDGKMKRSSTQASYVCVRMQMKGGLVARPVNAERTKWSLCYSAGESLSGGTDFSWFYGEDLSYSRDVRAVYGLEETMYTPASVYNTQKDKFNSMFRDAFVGDVWSLLKAIILAVCGYLAVISWLAYCVLTLGTGRFLFEILALKTGNGSFNGVDIIKFFTFGLYSLEDEPTLARVLIVTFVCILLIGCIVNWL